MNFIVHQCKTVINKSALIIFFTMVRYIYIFFLFSSHQNNKMNEYITNERINKYIIVTTLQIYEVKKKEHTFFPLHFLLLGSLVSKSGIK